MKKNEELYLFVLISAFLCVPMLSYAETIVLKSGQIIEGKLLEKTDKYIKIEFQGVRLMYDLDKVERISGAPFEVIKDNPVSKGEEDKMIEEIFSAAGIQDKLLQLQQRYPGTKFREQVTTPFKENFDKDKLQRVLAWLRSPLGKKINSLEKDLLTLGTLRALLPLQKDHAPTVISENRTTLLKRIGELDGGADFALECGTASFREYLYVTSELLPEDQRMSPTHIETLLQEKRKEWGESIQIAIFDMMVRTYQTLTDAELKNYEEFLRSDASQWFNDCYKKGFLRAMVSAAAMAAREGNLAQEALKGLREELILPDSPEWFLAYYYRNKETEEIVPLLKAVLGDRAARADRELRSNRIHYFASVLHEKSGMKEAFASLSISSGDKDKEFIRAITREAENFKPAVPDSPSGISRAWLEFQATGNEDIVKKIIALLGLPELSKPITELKHSAHVSLAKNAVKDHKVRDIITKLAVDADGAVRDKIEMILYFADSCTEISETFMHRGHNYRMLKKFEDALQENKNALVCCADYTAVYTNIANIYELKGDMKRALPYRQAVVYLNPESYVGNYGLGRWYFVNSRYEEAIKYLSKAVEYNPKSSMYNHALARAYQEKGDVDNAVKYFKRYLEYAPNGEFSALVRSYLDSVHASISEDETDPVVMLQKKQYPQLEQYLSSLLKSRKRNNSGGSALADAYARIVSTKGAEFISEQWLTSLGTWAKECPSSHFANACLGMFYVRYAWEARGIGFSNTVLEESRQLFNDRLVKAQEYLEKAYAIEPSDALVPAWLITVARGLKQDRQIMENQFQRAIKADPREYVAYESKLTYLMPKWYGSREEMFAFARECAKNAPPHSFIPIVLVNAHWEMHYRTQSGTYFRDPEVWHEVKAVYTRLLEDFPGNNKLRNWYAGAAYLAGDYKTAHEQFCIIKDDWDEEYWGNIKAFEKVKHAVASVADKK